MWETAFKLLLLVFIANGAPIVAARLLQHRLATPVDLGARWFDNHRVLGDSKTWRGLAASLMVTSVAAVLLGYSAGLGCSVAAAAMSGDMLSSLIKRRLGIESSGRATGLDQVPEALLPILAVQPQLPLPAGWIVLLVLAFVVLGLMLSRLLFTLKIRKRPY